MKNQYAKYLSLVVSLLYLSTALYVEVGHTDIVEYCSGGVHRLFSHNCTNNEIHHPLGNSDQCPVCVRGPQTAPSVSSVSGTVVLQIDIVSFSKSLSDISDQGRVIHGVRGPPCFNL